VVALDLGNAYETAAPVGLNTTVQRAVKIKLIFAKRDAAPVDIPQAVESTVARLKRS